MVIDIYHAVHSTPCRAIFIVAEALNIELNPILINIIEREQLKPEFLKLNPQHCVPTIVDEGFVLWESRAILTYLVNKYGKSSALYPEDPQQRALVDQRLYFDIGTLRQRFADYMYPQIFTNQPADQAQLKKIEEALELLNTFLEGNQWVAGPNPTVADISILCTVSIFENFDVDIYKYLNIKAWFERARNTIPGCKKTESAPGTFKQLIAEFKKKNAS